MQITHDLPGNVLAYLVPDLRLSYIRQYEGTCGNCNQKMILPPTDHRIYGLRYGDTPEYFYLFLVDCYIACPHCHFLHKTLQLWKNSTITVQEGYEHHT